MVGCLQVMRIYSFMEEIKVYIHDLYIVFLFVKTENKFIKEIKHVLCAFITWWKTLQSLWELLRRWKPLTVSRVFTDLLSNSSKRSPWFSPGYESREHVLFLNEYVKHETTATWNLSMQAARAIHSNTASFLEQSTTGTDYCRKLSNNTPFFFVITKKPCRSSLFLSFWLLWQPQFVQHKYF